MKHYIVFLFLILPPISENLAMDQHYFSVWHLGDGLNKCRRCHLGLLGPFYSVPQAIQIY